MKRIIYAMSILVAISVGFASCTQCCKQKEGEELTAPPATEVQPENVAATQQPEHVAGTQHPENVAGGQQTEVIETIHNARKSLDWAGTYTGTIPCADCEGINVKIVLRKDSTFDLVYHYLGRNVLPFEVTGNFTWNEDGSEIILGSQLDTRELPPFYRVGENKLIQLDMEGKVITGNLANKYILTKTF